MATIFFIIKCLYFFLPAYCANMAAPLVMKIPAFDFLAKPVDGGKTVRGERIFGNHKSWRGVIFAMIAGIAVFGIQEWLYQLPFFKNLSILDYQQAGICLVGFLMPLATVVGDLGSAFAKRRLKLEPGAKFMPWDQTNYVIGNFIIVGPVLKLDLSVWLVLLVATFFLHIIFNRIGYFFGLHGAKW